ncbi:unnamed protein product, partial [Chrysoparadoxa australica]
SLPQWGVGQRALEAGQSSCSGEGYTVVLVVPTGIGSAIGGYAGDALPVARAMSEVGDTVITHPNVMNGAMLYWPRDNVLYVEGYALDEFCAGRWGLLPVQNRGNRIGLVLDCAIEEELKLRHIQAADAARATLGIDVAGYAVTEHPVGVTLEMSEGGASWGNVANIETLLDAARHLVTEEGCTAVAVVVSFPEEEEEEFEAYRTGQGVDAVGGAEAIISHLITKELGVPCAHAPAVPPFPPDEATSPRACAEETGYTFLPCVLANLHRAPVIVKSHADPLAARAIWARDVDACVAPAKALGGAGVLSLASQPNTCIVGVAGNTCVMEAGATELGLGSVIGVGTYLEALGLLVAHKAGVNLDCFVPSMGSITRLK